MNGSAKCGECDEPPASSGETCLGFISVRFIPRQKSPSLRNLERDGLVSRTVTPSVPARVDYALAELGHSLREPVCRLGQWAVMHREAMADARARFDRERDQALAASAVSA